MESDEQMLLVVQNDPEVPAGNYGKYLEEFGIEFTLVCPFKGEALPPVEELRAVIVLGGAMGVHETATHPFLLDVKRFIRGLVERGVPYLGICLGGQLLADVLGARVVADSGHGEKGSLAVQLTAEGIYDPLFAGIPKEFITFQWHNDSFDIPAGGALLASSPVCPHQAFRYGANAYATQFHPEVDRGIVDSWVRWSEETASQATRFLTGFDLSLPQYSAASRQILANFLHIAGLV